MSYPFIIQGNNVVVVIDNKPHTISKTHITYQKVVDAIKAGDWETVKNTIDPVKVVVNYGKGNVSVRDETLYWKGEVFNGALATRMVAMLQDGFDIAPMVAFMENLMQNPSKRAVDELYGFLEKNNLPITPDGHFLAYKKVRRDFLDIHSGTMDNSPGKIVEMERNKVDDNKEQTCSTGLHFCSQDYLPHFGSGDSRVVIVKINPRDVVSIPVDYNNAKGRACRYEVIGEMNVSPEQAFTRPVQANANGTRTVEAPKPVVTKEGSSAFYMGYTDGWNDMDCRDEDNQDYVEGFDKGQRDADNGVGPRYRYVPKAQVNTATSINPGAWPFPKV